MILDSYALHSIIVQIQYTDAFLIWDRAGRIARDVAKIWPSIKFVDGQPNQQTLSGKDVQIQTALKQATITLRGAKALDQNRVRQITETFELWRDALELLQITRVSARSVYIRKFDSLKAANVALRALNVVSWPTERVFDQSMDAGQNGLEVHFRFEDAVSFTSVRLKAEELRLEVELDADFFDQPIKESRCRAVIDFDRGILGTIDASKFRMDDWLKGYVHVLRRDLDKVIGSKK